MKEIIQGFYQKKHFWTRLILVIAAVILMGFALSWLLLVDLGTDPCTLLNQTISTRLGISIGNWQALFNTVLLIFVIIFGGRNLGFGTLANMFLVGYSIDFFSWIWAKVLPAVKCTSCRCFEKGAAVHAAPASEIIPGSILQQPAGRW